MIKSLLFDLEKGTRPVLDLLRNDAVIDTVEYIRLEYWGDGNVLVSDEELVDIFGIIGALPRVQELRIEFDELPLPAQALQKVLSCPTSKLRYLALEDVRISGTIDDFEEVAGAIKRIPSLRTVRMYRCGPSYDTKATLDPIVSALADVPTLKDVTISSTHCSDEALGVLGDSNSLEVVALDHMAVCGQPLSQLCQSNSIQDLKLWGMPELNDDTTFLTSALASNQALKILRIRHCHLQKQSCNLLAEMIGQNTSLESLSLENLYWKDFGEPLRKAFTLNRFLKSISLSIDGKDINVQKNAEKLVSGLERNTSLKKLRLLLRDMDSQEVRDVFLPPLTKLLHQNFTLESVVINSGILDLGEDINFLLKLNRTGKRRLLRDDNAEKHEYLDLLAEHSEDMSITHYILTMNPALFSA